MESIQALVERARTKLTQRQQPEPPRSARVNSGPSAPTLQAPVPTTLADSIAQYVGDDDLQRLLARAKAAHDALPPRKSVVVGTATLCPPDAASAAPRRDYSRPMARLHPRDDKPCDWEFWHGHMRPVPLLAGITMGQMRRHKALQKHWRQAVAVVIGKWDGQVQVDRVALLHKIVPELARSRGIDPRDHPAYRVVFACPHAVAFAGVQDFVGKPA